MDDAFEIDDATVLAEVRAAFERYERALLANDVDTLDAMFWSDERVVRFGFDDAQHGARELAEFRRTLDRQSPPRQLTRVAITTLGLNAAVVSAEFRPDGSTAEGRQSQTWARIGGQWKVIHGHVSWAGGRGPESC